jgi:hypothetical protein
MGKRRLHLGVHMEKRDPDIVTIFQKETLELLYAFRLVGKTKEEGIRGISPL